MKEGGVMKPASTGSVPVPSVEKFAVAVFIGTAFGFLLVLGNVGDPKYIIGTLILRDFTMLEMFAAAVGTSLLVFYFSPQAKKIRMQFVKPIQQNGLLLTAIGGSFLGLGMALSGACPGTVFAQMGGNVHYAPLVFLGGVVGCLSFTFTSHIWQKNVAPIGKIEKHFFADEFAIPLAGVMFMIATGIELFLPHSGGIPSFIPGIGIGLLQIPLVYILESVLGSAAALKVLFSNIAFLVNPEVAGKFMFWKNGRTPLWLPVFAAFVIVGAYIVRPVEVVEGPSPLFSIIGGFVMFYGAHMMKGCTSKHGISGLGLLCVHSVVAVVGIFGTGMLVANVMNSFGLYSSFLLVSRY